MSKSAKIGLAVGGAVLVLVVAFVILVKVVVTPEKIRDNLLPLVEDSLQRKIAVEQIEIGLFSGVSLTELQIQKRSGSGNFIAVKSLQLSYKFLPLLTGKLVIDQVLLDQPRIEVTREADGRFNYTDLLGSKEQKSDQSADKKDKQPSGFSSSVFGLLVNDVFIRNGEILFIDRLQNPKSPFHYNLKQVDLEAHKISLDQSFPIQLSASLGDARIAVSGKYNIANQDTDLEVQLTALDLVQLSPYYRTALPGKLGSASLSVNLELISKQQQIESKGQLQLAKLDLLLDDYPEARLEKAQLGLDYAVTFDRKQNRIDISTLLVNLNEVRCAAEGNILLNDPEPKLSLSLLLDQLDLRSLADGLPGDLTKELRRYSLAGKIGGRFYLEGVPSDGPQLLKSADLDLQDVKATLNNSRAGVSGKIFYVDQQLESQQLVLQMADQQAQLEFQLSDLFTDVVKGNFKLSADRFDLNKVLPQPAQTAARNTSSPTQQLAAAEEVGPFDLPLDLHGQLSIGRLLYKQLPLEQLQADLVLKNNLLQINQLNSKIAGGQLSAIASINLGIKGLNYKGQMNLDRHQLQPLVSGLFPGTRQQASGVLISQNSFSGRGTVPDTLLHALRLNGALQLTQGQLSGSLLQDELALFLGLSELKLLSFNAIDANYDLRNGEADINGRVDSSKIRMQPKGTVSVDGDIDMGLDARLAPALLDKVGVKSGLKQRMTDEEGWGVFPLAVKGNLSSPRISFDSEALRQQAGDQLKKEASKKLLEKLGGKDEQEKEPVKQILEGTLDKLLGK